MPVLYIIFIFIYLCKKNIEDRRRKEKGKRKQDKKKKNPMDIGYTTQKSNIRVQTCTGQVSLRSKNNPIN